MIIKGKSRAAAGQLAAYLLAQGKNESVRLVTVDNTLSQDLRGCLLEMQEVAAGSECEKPLYHASINPKEDEHLTPEQWAQAVDLLEKNLGLEGHQRAIVEHVKDGRAHYHIVWNRVNVDTLTAVRMSHNYLAHELTARQLEREFGLERVQGAHAERDGPRPERQPKQWEMDRASRSGIDPRKVKSEVSELWTSAKNGADFASALEARGYVLAKGDRRDFVVVDRYGDPHSITRRTGAKAAEVRAKLADIDRADLPTVEQAKEMQEERREHSAAASLEKLYDRGDMASQQLAAHRQHEQRQKALENADELKRREEAAFKRLDARVEKRDNAGQERQPERTARTEQTDAAQAASRKKELMRQLFEMKFGRGHNEKEIDSWERDRGRER